MGARSESVCFGDEPKKQGKKGAYPTETIEKGLWTHKSELPRMKSKGVKP